MIVAANADGRIIDVEPLNYVRQTDNGWSKCTREEAQAIAHHNQRYAIEGGAEVDEELPIAIIYTVPDGSLTVEALGLARDHTGQITDLETGTLDLGDAVADLETGTLDLADALDSATSDTETALVDLADTIEELNGRIAALEG